MTHILVRRTTKIARPKLGHSVQEAFAVAAACLLWSVGARADTQNIGTVVAWGANWYGQTNVPATATGVTQVAAGYGHNVALLEADCNNDGLLDSGQIALDPTIDANTDGVIDACQGMGVVFLCPGDLDGGGSVDTADLSLLLMGFGAAMPGDPADLDASGQIDTADLSLMLLSFGDC
jgi:hypothetical protein